MLIHDYVATKLMQYREAELKRRACGGEFIRSDNADRRRFWGLLKAKPRKKSEPLPPCESSASHPFG
ncbi:hypothetical protein ACFPYJ_16415 [Paenibacillus solisilvae]|uniref:Uncharacterized protein n=1 Tax=Paenibacillus solisilvae TaxID=2486751 RepID=A0ABW0W0Y1_9BACL